jgi:hypothetical protein
LIDLRKTILLFSSLLVFALSVFSHSQGQNQRQSVRLQPVCFTSVIRHSRCGGALRVRAATSAERDQRSHHHADRPVQVGLHRRSSAQENARFRDGQIVSASATAAPDAGTSDCDSYPVMALIISDSVADYPNVLLCRSGLLIGEQVYPGSRTACAPCAFACGGKKAHANHCNTGKQHCFPWQATLFSSWLFSMAGWSKNFK